MNSEAQETKRPINERLIAEETNKWDAPFQFGVVITKFYFQDGKDEFIRNAKLLGLSDAVVADVLRFIEQAPFNHEAPH